MTMGLPAPLVAHRFRVDLMGNRIFQQSVETFDLNIVKKEVVVSVRETCECEIMPLVVALAEHQSTSMTWEGIEKSGETVSTIFFHGLKLIDHNFATSYLEMSSAKHILTFSYERMDKQ
jgi:hypothetical protein